MSGNRMDDRHSYKFSEELRGMFPEQTKSIPGFLIWCVIYLLNVAFVVWLCFRLGINLIGMRRNTQSLMIAVLLLAALGLLKVETFIYNKIVSLFR